jgi:hypothetical protein
MIMSNQHLTRLPLRAVTSAMYHCLDTTGEAAPDSGDLFAVAHKAAGGPACGRM